jgi:hypothetical protein
MKIHHAFLLATLFPCFAFPASSKENPNFSTGVFGTSFISNSGSSALDYKFLVDYKIQGRHTIELKFAIRDANQDGQRDLHTEEETETVMINCKQKTFTPSYWLKENDNAYGYKQYANGDKFIWNDKVDGLTNFGSDFPSYLKMICNSL